MTPEEVAIRTRPPPQLQRLRKWVEAPSGEPWKDDRIFLALPHAHRLIAAISGPTLFDSLPSGDGLSPSHPAADKEALPGSP